MENILEKSDHLFQRIVTILEQARNNTVLAVNSNMVKAYWLIGREIVQDMQDGKSRADYGQELINTLSNQLSRKYGKGFSVASLKSFRQFFLTYPDRIGYPVGSQSTSAIQKSYPLGSEFPDFSSQLSWSHYRAIMRLDKPQARDFYETQAVECCWSKRTLERHIHSQYYERLLKSQNPQTMLDSADRETPLPEESLKNPYVLEFLGLPDTPGLHENNLESAIIEHIQEFLLELGKGFAFVARQKQIRFGETDYYIDLVFYNFILKCHVLVDLKVGELTHQDVGQMDGYVRMFDDLYAIDGDNPTIGLILCTEKNDAVAKYSVLNDRNQIFASKYMLYLPTEQELALELKKERYFIEQQLSISDNK